MATTSPHQSPASEQDTPTHHSTEIEPYRLPTEAVRIWEPRPATTEELTAIRMKITPNRGWWQNLDPRLIVWCVSCYTVTVGGLFAFVATHGAIR